MRIVRTMKSEIEIPTREEIDPKGLFSDKQHEGFAMYARGEYWDDICEKLGLSSWDAHNLIFCVVHAVKDWQSVLSHRCQNALTNELILTKKQALQFIANGAKTRNFGQKCLAELRAALNLPEEDKKLNWGVNKDGNIVFPKGSCVTIKDLEKILDYAKKITGNP